MLRQAVTDSPSIWEVNMGIFKQALINDREAELPYFYFISKTMCIGIRTYLKMQSFFGSPKMFYEAGAARIEKTGIFTKMQLEKIADTRKNFNPERAMEELKALNIKIIPYEDELYPERLRTIKDAPIVLFLRGKLPTLYTPCASIVGARECTSYGANVASRLGELFAAMDVCVVSGMARGIDSISQSACLEAGGTSLALLGGGVDVIYPKESRALYDKLCHDGGVLSEYPPGTDNLPQYFAARNRLISGLSDVVCVIEAREKSGTMITVDCALDQGREVYAVPGRITDITSFGTNELIRQGAGILTDIDGFVDEFVRRFSYGRKNLPAGIQAPGHEFETLLNPSEITALTALDDNSFTAEQLSKRTKIQAFELLSICISLTQKGLLNSLGAGRFSITNDGTVMKNKLLSNVISS